MGVADLAADEDARGGKVGRGAAVETERNPRPPLRSAEGHFVRRLPVGRSTIASPKVCAKFRIMPS